MLRLCAPRGSKVELARRLGLSCQCGPECMRAPKRLDAPSFSLSPPSSPSTNPRPRDRLLAVVHAVLTVHCVVTTTGAPPAATTSTARPPTMCIALLTCAASPCRAGTAAPIGALDAELTGKGCTSDLASADGNEEYVTPITIDGQSASDVCVPAWTCDADARTDFEVISVPSRAAPVHCCADRASASTPARRTHLAH
jgi:hypothetical protein